MRASHQLPVCLLCKNQVCRPRQAHQHPQKCALDGKGPLTHAPMAGPLGMPCCPERQAQTAACITSTASVSAMHAPGLWAKAAPMLPYHANLPCQPKLTFCSAFQLIKLAHGCFEATSCKRPPFGWVRASDPQQSRSEHSLAIESVLSSSDKLFGRVGSEFAEAALVLLMELYLLQLATLVYSSSASRHRHGPPAPI